MTVRLRPHHLLCMLTYVGKGYSPAFVENYDGIAERLSAGEEIVIVEGPDEICGPVADAPGSHCRFDSVTERDTRAALDAGALLGVEIEAGTRLRITRERLAALRRAFRVGSLRRACTGCEWKALCTEVAEDGFADVRIRRDCP
ncbi:DUF1284 domain-containing protein [Rhizobium sp. YIM 134829]|uniref:DUF1284 domain-containing protein n=1 Tax=Rhizobium sp. YIM 134829 TaxID=3390453 RepID=UPI0039783DC5